MDFEEAGARGRIILCADDYAITEGVSRSIDELADAGRLSATSAIVTSRHWPQHSARARALRGRMAVGLHVNLTLGAPLGAMPRLAPAGRLPSIGELTARALRGDIDREEIAAEVSRQIARFSAECGHPPDLIDGHQHVHVLPAIRDGVIDAISTCAWIRPPLVRNPSDRFAAILQRRTAVPKALALWWLARGFGDTLRRAGLPCNDSFAGVTGFAPGRAAAELARGRLAARCVHIIMCHPGYADDELAAIDPVTERRRAEHDILIAADLYGDSLWRPRRAPSGPPVDWRAELAVQR